MKNFKVLFGALLLSLVSFSAQAGTRSAWTIDIYRVKPGSQEVPLASQSYLASQLSTGEIITLRGNQPNILSGTGRPENLTGHFKLALLEASPESAKLLFKAWDRKGLPAHSASYRSMFSSEHRLKQGEAQEIRFTQGDASKPGEAIHFRIVVKLEALEACDDQGNCQKL